MAVVGCSSDEDAKGDCAQRVGTYLVTYKTRSGDCGAIPEQLTALTEQPTEVTAPCTGTIAYSADNCNVTSTVECPEPGLGTDWTSTVGLKATWDESASRGTAIHQMVLYNEAGGIECQGTYDATIVKQ